MSYEKMMKRIKGHRHDKDYQTTFYNVFKGATSVQGEKYWAEEEMKRTNICYIKVCNRGDEDFIKIPLSFKTEEEAIDYSIKEKLEEKYRHGMICTENDFALCKW